MTAFQYDRITPVLKNIGEGELGSFLYTVHVGDEFSAECDMESDRDDMLKSQTGRYPLRGIQVVEITYTDGDSGEPCRIPVGYADVSGIDEILNEIFGYVKRIWGV